MLSHKGPLRLTILDLPLFLFVVSAFVGVWPAHDRNSSWHALIALCAGLVLYGLVSRLAVSPRWWHTAAWFTVLMSVFLSVYFVAQHPHFGYAVKVETISHISTLIGKIVPPAVVWVPFANSVATFLEGGLFLAIALALTVKRKAWRIGGVVGTSVIALALLMSTSRGAWLAAVVVAAIWMAIHWSWARAIVKIGGMVALVLAIYVVARNDIEALSEIPVINRVVVPMFVRPDRFGLYRNAVHLIQDFPLTGLGLGQQFAMVYSKYSLLIHVPFLTYSHNLYLEVWLQQGLLGVVAWLWLVVAIYQAAHTRDKPDTNLLFQSTWIGLTAILIHGLSDARQYADLWCWFPFFSLLGLNSAVLPRSTRRSFRGGSWVFPAGAVGVLLVGVLVTHWPISATWHSNLGCVLQARGDLLESLNDGQQAVLRQQAIDHFQRAIQIAPRNRTARQRLGVILMEQGHFSEAVEHLQVAWRVDPNNTTTHKALGLAYVWVGQLDEALPLLQKVPNIVQELNYWGWWRSTQQETEQAINAYRMSLLLNPDQPGIGQWIDRFTSS